MTKKQKAEALVTALEQEYPDAACSLDYKEPFPLLVSVRLAAQCTDARVNQITPLLFDKFPTMEALAAAPVEEVAAIVRPCGLGNTKARDIVAMSEMLLAQYGGVVPDTMEELLKLPGVGRKSANLILGDVYGKPAVVTDTHCIRITNLMGLSSSKTPYQVETQLRKVLPMERANDFCHRLVIHGRAVCKARNPQCGICCCNELCTYGKKVMDKSGLKT